VIFGTESGGSASSWDTNPYESPSVASLYFLHALGGSAREWDRVVAALGDDFDCIPLDLPGFGGSADAASDVTGLVDWFAAEVGRRQPQSWAVIGHSMGGKIATLAAARAREGDPSFAGLAAVVLLAASPPAPEPMAEDRRAKMIGWCAGGGIDTADAEAFVDANTAASLSGPDRAQAIADVERSGCAAWTAWLERGSREDWRSEAGIIALPALIVAGGEDGDLGVEAQRRLNLPHYRVEVVDGAAHLLPYERPAEVAALIRDHVAPAFARALPAPFAALLASARVSRRARAAMMDRHAAPDAAGTLSTAQRATLVALIETLLPGAVDAPDLARRIDASLAEGRGDGWRLADLPADALAWQWGLDTLEARTPGFASASAARREEALRAIGEDSGEDGGGETQIERRHMRLWFAEARAEVARQWVALPATMARIGYDGFAVGGDDMPLPGYRLTAANAHEPWQSLLGRPA
jgi:pimeloyl-ACP methyl ester carboxylesterase